MKQKQLKYFFLVFFLLFNSACGGGSSSGNDTSVLLEDLVFPGRVRVLDSDTLLVAEFGSGKIFQYDIKTSERTDVITFPPFTSDGGGISGLLVDREFDSNGYVYVYHTNEEGRNVLTGFILRNGVAGARRTLREFTQKSGHNGGGMYQFTNGNILLGIGDGGKPAFAQDAGKHEGKILLLNRAGVLQDAGIGLPLGVYALGLRNPYGMDGSGDDQIFVADNGPECDDEINKLKAGGNYGWRDAYVCGQHLPGHIAPLHVWPTSVGITDVAYLPAQGLVLTSLYNSNTLHSLRYDRALETVSSTNIVIQMDESIIGLSRFGENAISFTTTSKVYTLRGLDS